jgi:nickel/cobalt exporter
MTGQSAQPGSLIRGDFLSRLLHERTLSLSMLLIAFAASFGLGALHALTPGHGKAIVAAYLVGARGTLKHAAFLGAMVTFTHTVAVFALGLATLFLFKFIVPEQITVFLGVLSGLSIVVIGAIMLYQRIHQVRCSRAHAHAHSHTHSHPHDHGHAHHHHGPAAHTHSHHDGGHTHSHVPDELSWKGLIALGVSGGLVPCESALVLLLGAIAIGRVGFGLLLLLSFSLGLALVLMLIGILVIYAKNLLPQSTRSAENPVLRWISIASPAVVMVAGLLMTAASLGLIESKWTIG